MPTAAIAWPTLDLWVQASIALLCDTHVCVCVLTTANGLSKLLTVQNPQLTTFTYCCCNTHVCVLTAALGRDPQSVYPETHMCMPQAASGRPTFGLVCAHNSNWSAKPQVTYDQNLHLALFCARDVCAHSSYWSCACPQQQLVGQPLILGCPQVLYSATHMCLCSQQQFGLPKLLNVQNPQSTPSLSFAATHMYSRISNGSAKPQLASSATHMCVCVLTAAIALAKLLNVQDLQLISPSIFSATHKCVLTAAIGRPALGQGQKPLCWPKSSKGQHTCVC